MVQYFMSYVCISVLEDRENCFRFFSDVSLGKQERARN